MSFENFFLGFPAKPKGSICLLYNYKAVTAFWLCMVVGIYYFLLRTLYRLYIYCLILPTLRERLEFGSYYAHDVLPLDVFVTADVYRDD